MANETAIRAIEKAKALLGLRQYDSDLLAPALRDSETLFREVSSLLENARDALIADAARKPAVAPSTGPLPPKERTPFAVDDASSGAREMAEKINRMNARA